jgi:hypothetical protein
VDVDPFAVAVDVALAGAYDPQRSVIHAGVEDLHSWHNPVEHGAVEPRKRADRLAVDAELHTVLGVDLVRSLPPLSRSPLPPPPPSAGARQGAYTNALGPARNGTRPDSSGRSSTRERARCEENEEEEAAAALAAGRETRESHNEAGPIVVVYFYSGQTRCLFISTGFGPE